jgi:hypothetical protein
LTEKLRLNAAGIKAFEDIDLKEAISDHWTRNYEDACLL